MKCDTIYEQEQREREIKSRLLQPSKESHFYLQASWPFPKESDLRISLLRDWIPSYLRILLEEEGLYSTESFRVSPKYQTVDAVIEAANSALSSRLARVDELKQAALEKVEKATAILGFSPKVDDYSGPGRRSGSTFPGRVVPSKTGFLVEFSGVLTEKELEAFAQFLRSPKE